MNRFSLLVDKKLDFLKVVFLEGKYMNSLGLQKHEDIENGLIFQNPKTRTYCTLLEIKQKDNDSSKCLINLVVYEKKKYNIQINENTEELLNRQLDIIKGILFREKIDYKDDDLENVKSLLQYASENLKGSTRHIEKLSSLGWIKIVAFLGVLGSIGYLLYKGGSAEGVIGVIVVFLLYIVYETKDFRNRQPK